jgi:uncharacterized membrane protein
MSGPQLSLVISVFLACAVEAVEAFTIVLAVGSTRKWSSALLGVGVAAVVLGVLIAALGPALTVLPVEVLRLVVGGLLLVFGLQWLQRRSCEREEQRRSMTRWRPSRRRQRRAERAAENSMKFVVGVLLTTFGVFWGAEGAGASWPGKDAALSVLAALIVAASWLLVRGLRADRSRLALWSS